MRATVVLDIGKTNAKLTLLDPHGTALASLRCANVVLDSGPYPHHDTERLWDWLLTSLRLFARQADITAIVPVTHGATAALVDGHGLVLPVLDYESAAPQAEPARYAALRPPYADTGSPDLPAGLNLGRQLYWLSQQYPAEFDRARHILNYPQYWAWRLCGVAAGEVTSFGCHTDLWQPQAGTYSALVDTLGWRHLLPPLRPAWDALGPLRPELAELTGIAGTCQVLCGIHDSNASLLRYLPQPTPDGAAAQPVTVLTTGTWAVLAAIGRPLDGLDESRDMLANVNALGQPVACMRFMGGREFAALAGPRQTVCTADELQWLIQQRTLALPCFADAGGPFSGRVGQVTGPAPNTAAQRYALATLYCVLMSDYCLDALGGTGMVVIEGSFTDNPHFAPLLAALRGSQPVALTDDTSGTTCGGWMLSHWGDRPAAHGRIAAPLALTGLRAYRERWRAKLVTHALL